MSKYQHAVTVEPAGIPRATKDAPYLWNADCVCGWGRRGSRFDTAWSDSKLHMSLYTPTEKPVANKGNSAT